MRKQELKKDIKQYLACLKKEASLPDVKMKIQRLAELNVSYLILPSSQPLTHEEEVERQFLRLTLPHVSRIGEISDLLKKLK